MTRTYGMISGDSHLEVPCDWWTPRVPERYRQQAPRRITMAGGGDGFVGEGSPVIFGGTGHYAGKTPETFNPMVAEDMKAAVGSGAAEQRLKEQDADGVDAELLFPSNTAMKACRGIQDDRAFAAVIHAYNEYLAEEYCAHDPERLLGVGVLPLRGLETDIREMEYCKKAGLATVVMGRYPGGNTYPTPEDDRFWAAAIDLQMPLSIHTFLGNVRGGTFLPYPKKPEGEITDDDFYQRMYRHAKPHAGGVEALQMVMAGVFHRFPKLRIYWAENNVGWLPYYYQHIDLEWERNHHWGERLFGALALDRPPSEYIKEYAYWGFFDDSVGINLRHEVGVDRIIWGSDFPHVVTPWPRSREMLARQMSEATEEEKIKMTSTNLIDFLHIEATAKNSGI
ncbi:MAG: amidohydrolase family protein [Deltaproteobacteria bacterium]|nr:amidohydrolase family protein [Deltaproteobacteria bacterium]